MTAMKCTLAIFLACALLTALCTQAIADSYTAYVAKDGAVVYDSTGAEIGTVKADTKLTVTETRGNICEVQKGDKTAYMKKEDLRETTPEPEPTATPAPTADDFTAVELTMYVARDGAEVCNIDGDVIGSVDADLTLTCTGVRDDLCRVQRDGHTGYMKKSDLSRQPVSTPAPTPTPAPTAEPTPEPTPTPTPVPTPEPIRVTAYVSKNSAKVYNAEGRATGSLSVNRQVTVTAVKGNACRVEVDGHTVYMRKSDLSRQKVDAVETVNRTAYAASNGVKVYDAEGTVIMLLDVNAQVRVTAVKGNACRVSVIGRTGFMRASDLSDERVDLASGLHALKVGDKGEDVKKVQTRLRELGYFSGSIGGNYQALMQSAVSDFQIKAGLEATGDCDEVTLKRLFSGDAPSAAIKTVIGKGVQLPSSTVTPAHGRAQAMDWWTSGIQSLFPRGMTVTVTDVETGLSWREQRRGGSKHADVQPLTAADTAVLKRVYGGAWSWKRRAIIVTINGVNYAASMNGMPHGGGTIDNNNFDGHHCIHFTNSRTHGTNRVCELHQAAIQKALKARL